MCKRSTGDPLVRKFLDDYGVNLLRLPRERAACGDLYIKSGRVVSTAFDVRQVLEPPVTLPALSNNELLADFRGTSSSKVAFAAGFGLLENFLTALGAAGVVNNLKVDMSRKRARSLEFRFRDVTRDSVDAGLLGTALEGRNFKALHPLVRPENEYYVVGGVLRSPSISITATDDRAVAVKLAVDVIETVSGTARASVEQDDAGEVTYRGRTPLAIGVQLWRLHYDADRGGIEMATVAKPLGLHGRRRTQPPPALIGEDEDVFLDVSG